MKVLCEKDELIKGMQTIIPVTSNKTTLPVLSNFLFEAKDKKIKLLATDLEISVQSYVKGEIVKEGAITIPSKRFADILKELPQDKQIEIRTDNSNQILIKSGNSNFTLMGINSSEYPSVPGFPKENNFSISKDVFIPMLKKTVFAVSKDSQRFVLTGIYLVMKDGTLKIAATDGRRLAYIFSDGIDKNIKSAVIAPSKVINEIIRLVSEAKEESIQIGISDNRFAVKFDDITVISTLVDGIFPNYEQVIPSKSEIIVKINAKETLTAVRQMSLLTGNKMTADRSSAVKFSFSKNSLTISAAMAGVGSGETSLDIEYDKEPIEISFNPTYVKDILQNIDVEFAKVEMSGNVNPAVISPDDGNKNYICVIMPMRV
ncbi:MAG: DNA polymerase III subunit beta [Elusimicrobiota bacterium]|jgi:DNA polymerase-3 subunit beta|nr:DNA polymerase III subunit beta [Elusimicrobiota bacterium]